MKKIIKNILAWFKRLFSKKLSSVKQTHWVNHICDEFIPPPSPAVQWYNLHGFDEGPGIVYALCQDPGIVYWVGLDCRNFGIRSADYVIKCKTKALYDEYIEVAHDGGSAFLQKALHDDRLNLRRGNNVEIEFIFKWADEEKTFDVHLAGDFYAEEK